MPKEKTPLQKALGKLVLSIQKEWGEELGEGISANISEDVLDLAHSLLQAKTADLVLETLGSLSIQQYLGDTWVCKHPNVKQAIAAVENALSSPYVESQSKIK